MALDARESSVTPDKLIPNDRCKLSIKVVRSRSSEFIVLGTVKKYEHCTQDDGLDISARKGSYHDRFRSLRAQYNFQMGLINSIEIANYQGE